MHRLQKVDSHLISSSFYVLMIRALIVPMGTTAAKFSSESFSKHYLPETHGKYVLKSLMLSSFLSDIDLFNIFQVHCRS